MFDLIQLGFYILFFIPGFIFVQTKDYHLLRGNKSQFEKTLEIILWTAILWCLAFIFPYWYPSVKYKFIEENINKAIEFKLDNNKYIGVMLNAPDNQNDKHIIVEKVILIEKNKFIPLNHIKTMLINYDKLDEIKAYKDDYIKKEVKNE